MCEYVGNVKKLPKVEIPVKKLLHQKFTQINVLDGLISNIYVK